MLKRKIFFEEFNKKKFNFGPVKIKLKGLVQHPSPLNDSLYDRSSKDSNTFFIDGHGYFHGYTDYIDGVNMSKINRKIFNKTYFCQLMMSFMLTRMGMKNYCPKTYKMMFLKKHIVFYVNSVHYNEPIKLLHQCNSNDVNHCTGLWHITRYKRLNIIPWYSEHNKYIESCVDNNRGPEICKHGIYRERNKWGKLIKECNYENNLLEGVLKEWDNDGKLLTCEIYQNNWRIYEN